MADRVVDRWCRRGDSNPQPLAITTMPAGDASGEVDANASGHTPEETQVHCCLRERRASRSTHTLGEALESSSAWSSGLLNRRALQAGAVRK